MIAHEFKENMNNAKWQQTSINTPNLGNNGKSPSEHNRTMIKINEECVCFSFFSIAGFQLDFSSIAFQNTQIRQDNIEKTTT